MKYLKYAIAMPFFGVFAVFQTIAILAFHVGAALVGEQEADKALERYKQIIDK